MPPKGFVTSPTIVPPAGVQMFKHMVSWRGGGGGEDISHSNPNSHVLDFHLNLGCSDHQEQSGKAQEDTYCVAGEESR